MEENLWPEEIGDLKLYDTRKYGRNMIKFYRNTSQSGLSRQES